MIVVRSDDEAVIVRGAGAFAARSLDDPAIGAEFGPCARLEAGTVPSGPAPASAASTLLLDTAPERLLDRLAFQDIARLASLANDEGRRLAFSGGLEAPDIPRLLPLSPSFLAFDEAVRAETGRLDEGALAEIVALFAEPERPVAFAGEPDRVFVRDLVEEMEVGAYASERGRRQRVRFSVDAELAPRSARRAADIYSYDRIMDAVRTLVSRPPEPFVETLAEALAADLLEDKRLLAVTVRVEKLDLGPGAAGVEIRRVRPR